MYGDHRLEVTLIALHCNTLELSINNQILTVPEYSAINVQLSKKSNKPSALKKGLSTMLVKRNATLMHEFFVSSLEAVDQL